MPCGLIEQQNSMCTGRDVEGDLFQMHAHRLTVAAGHNDACSLAFGRADRAEDPGRSPALVLWSQRAGAPLCPAAGEPGLLADPGFVLPP